MFTEISSRSIGKLWKSLLLIILKNGQDIRDGSQIIKELCNVIISLKPNTILTDPIFEKFYDKKWIDFMKSNFFEMAPIDSWGYSYGQRLYDYKSNDQIKNVIEKLKNNPLTKSATISLAYPPEDKKHMPCIVCIDFKIRQGMLNITSYFRSQDAGKKFCADIICLKELQDIISKKINVKIGYFYLVCSSMHIYESEFDQVNQICRYGK